MFYKSIRSMKEKDFFVSPVIDSEHSCSVWVRRVDSDIISENFNDTPTQTRLLTTLHKNPFKNIVGKGENAVK